MASEDRVAEAAKSWVRARSWGGALDTSTMTPEEVRDAHEERESRFERARETGVSLGSREERRTSARSTTSHAGSKKRATVADRRAKRKRAAQARRKGRA